MCDDTFCWKRNSSPTADDEIRPHHQNSGSFGVGWSAGPPIGCPLSHPFNCSYIFVSFPPCVNLRYWGAVVPLVSINHL
jgi:hypothetical protein